jgi:hypothetical protein
MFFLSFSIYLFFNKIIYRPPEVKNTLTFTFPLLFSCGKEDLRRCIFSRGTKEQINDSHPNILIYKAFPPCKNKEHRRTKPPPRGTKPQSKRNKQIKNALIDNSQKVKVKPCTETLKSDLRKPQNPLDILYKPMR